MHRPREITSELRKKIIEDLRVKAAFKLAQDQARKLAGAAGKTDLPSAAKAAGVKPMETGFFPRKIVRYSMRARRKMQLDYMWKMLQSKEQLPAYTKQMLNAEIAKLIPLVVFPPVHELIREPPYAFTWSRLDDINLPTDEHCEYFMKRAFSLIPDDVDQPDTDAASAVLTFPLPANREVLVIERIGYIPAVTGDFEKHGRYEIAGKLAEIQGWWTSITWFNAERVKIRMGYTPKEHH